MCTTTISGSCAMFEGLYSSLGILIHRLPVLYFRVDKEQLQVFFSRATLCAVDFLYPQILRQGEDNSMPIC